MASDETLWNQYALNVDLYKFYLDLVVKVNAYYYAVTGAILTYYFQNPTNTLSRYALLLPIAFSVAISVIFIYGSCLLGVVRLELFSIRDKLGLESAPEIQVLVVFLRVFGVILLITGVALVVFFAKSGTPVPV
jgi:hypothetical protein